MGTVKNINVHIFRVTAPASVKHSHLAVGEVEVVTHFHRQRPAAAAAEVHDAVLTASVWHVVDCKHSLTRRVPLKETKKKREDWVYTTNNYFTEQLMIF